MTVGDERQTMPQEIEIDGEKKTVYTEDEVKPLQAGHDANKEKKAFLGKLSEELGLEEGQGVEDKIKELKESANPNWSKFRGTFKNMQKALKDKGVEVDDETGHIVTNEKGLTADEIKKIVAEQTSETIKKELSQTKRDEFFAGYSEEDRKKVEPVFDKLQSLGGDSKENFDLAVAKVFPGRQSSPAREAYNNAIGGGPFIKKDGKEDFTETDKGKDLAKRIGLKFVKKEEDKK